MNKRGSSQPSIWMKIDIKLNENKTTNAHAQQTQNCSKENARKKRAERTLYHRTNFDSESLYK